MKRAGITFLLISIVLNSFADDSINKINRGELSLLLRVSPSNFFLEDPISVYQFGGETRYKKYGISLEYGLQKRKINMPNVNRYYNRYNSIRAEGRIFKEPSKENSKSKSTKYLAIEYFYREQFSNYHYHQFDKRISYYPFVEEHAYYDLKMSYQSNGLTIKQGKIIRFNDFEFDMYAGIGAKYVKTRIVYKRGSDETDNTVYLHTFYQNLSFKNQEKIRLNVSLGFKLAYTFYSFKPTRNSFLDRL
jgi:hypothetical protein